MSKSINKLHAYIGDWLREIDKIKKAAREYEETHKVKPKRANDKIQAFRKKIEEMSNKLQKGMGW